jgi:hypothetical protein
MKNDNNKPMISAHSEDICKQWSLHSIDSSWKATFISTSRQPNNPAKTVSMSSIPKITAMLVTIYFIQPLAL